MIRIPDPPSAAAVAAASMTVSINKSSPSSAAPSSTSHTSHTSSSPILNHPSATQANSTTSSQLAFRSNTNSSGVGGNMTDFEKNVKMSKTELATDTSTSSAPVVGANHNMNIVITSLIAGAMAGALAKTAIAPLDRAKINFQINKDIPYSFRAAANFLKQCLVNEGVTALWRGNSATMARIVPYAAIQFTAHEQFKKLLHVDQGQSTKLRRFWAGAFAGITSQTLTYPLDLARARMAVTERKSGYSSLRVLFTRMWVEEGPRTLFRGYWPTLLGVIPYAGTSFFTYDTLKREYTEHTGGKKPSGMISLCFGACAGVVGQTSSYPLDIVRRRMQTAGVVGNGGPDPYSTIMITLRKIYREEGIKKGFFKGLSMNWIKGPIAVGISFSTYELIKETLRDVFGIDVTVLQSDKK